MGKGHRVQFCTNRWCGDESLRESCPMLLSVASIKDAWVAEMWEQIEEGGCWSVRFVK